MAMNTEETATSIASDTALALVELIRACEAKKHNADFDNIEDIEVMYKQFRKYAKLYKQFVRVYVE